MTRDKSKITSTQFMFTVACFFQATTLLTTFLVKIVLQDTWVVVLAGIFLVLPLYALMFYMIKTFPGKTLIEINEIVFGKFVGKFISCIYLLFFISLTSLNFIDMGEFIHMTIMNKTPIIVLLIIFVTVTIWAVKSGINVGTRFNTMFSLIIGIFIIIDTLLVYKFIDVENIMPFLDIQPAKLVQGLNIFITIPLGEIIIIMMIVPRVDASYKKIKKSFYLGYAIGMISFVIVVFREILVLGDTLELFAMPSFQTLKLIDLAPVLSRVEIVLVLILMIMGFTKSVVMLYASVVALMQILNIQSFKATVVSLGLICIIYSANIYEDILKHGELGPTVTPIIWFFIEFILPFITFLMMQIRRQTPENMRKKLRRSMQ